MAVIVVVFAHPYPSRSRANARLLAAIESLDSVEVHDLYGRYPDFDLDLAAEQEALSGARAMVWMHPVFWYSTPALMKHWLDQVLAKGWAYGAGGTALAGKRCLWVPTTGGDEEAYSAAGRHARPFSDYVPAVEQTARYCGLDWQQPFVLHGAHILDDVALEARAAELRDRVEALAR